MRTLFTCFVLISLLYDARSQSCPGCSIDYSYTVPGVYPLTLPAAVAGEYYETDLTFVLAEDTATDFGTFEFLNYHIMEPLGMPYGLNASSDAGDFPVDYDPDVSLYGCVKICGTPLIAGIYTVTVPLIATLEDPAGDQPAEYTLSIEVLPPAGSSGGFSASTTFGCSPTIINFTTSYPSDGTEGYSYFWDFGNGFTSTDEIPSPQFYYAVDSPETYLVEHTVTIDTVGYILDYIKITSTGCDDCTIFGCTGLFPEEKPDLYLIIESLDINTFPGFADTDPPVTFILDVPIDPLLSYEVNVKDDDAGATGSDDNCGSDSFAGDAVGITTIDIGSSTIEVSISHPVITYTFYDTLFIYPYPPSAIVSASDSLSFCAGDSVVLSTYYNSTYQYQWYSDATPIVGADSSEYIATESGNYSVTVTAEGGCADTSALFPVIVYAYPPGLVIVVTDNVLHTTTTYPVQWYYDGDPIPGATEIEYTPAIEGNYSVCATNVFCTTCSPEFAFVFQDIGTFETNFIILPNPNTGVFTVRVPDVSSAAILSLTTMQGQHVDYNIHENPSLSVFEMQMHNPATGLYFLTLQMHGQIITKKVLIE